MLWIPMCFSPTSPDLLHHQPFGSVLIRLPHCCLHSSPSCSSPSQLPHPTFRKQLKVNKQTGFFADCPHQPFQLIPLLTRCLDVLALWAILSHVRLYVHTGPSVPKPGSIAAGHRKKVKGGSCLCLLFLQGVPVPSVFPQSSIIMLNK